MEQNNMKKGRDIFVKNAKDVSIAKLNTQIGERLSLLTKDGEEVFLDEKEKAFRKYEACMKENGVVTICFDACDIDGTFSTYDNGILIKLPGSSVKEAQDEVDVYTTARMLGINFSLKITEVSRENNQVICSVPGSTKATVKRTVKSEIQKEISKIIEKGESPLVWGRITNVQPRRALVDILGQGVLGIIDVSHWQKCYTRSLIGMCKEGEFYQFEIKKKAPKKAGADTAWMLSRREITKNVWDEIDYKNLQPGGNLLVRCIEKPEGKSYWWGQSDRLPGIELMGDFTDKINPSTVLLEGITYKCKIKEIFISKEDYKKNKFSVIPYGIDEQDMNKVEAVKKLRTSEK